MAKETIYLIHECILEPRCGSILNELLSTSVTRPEVMVDDKWIYTTEFRARKEMVNRLLNVSSTKSIDFSVPLRPLEGTELDYRIPLEGSIVLEVVDPATGKVVTPVVHAECGGRTPLTRDKVRSMCLCVYCVTDHQYTVLDFSTTKVYPDGVLVKYREFQTSEKPLHSRSFY